MTERSAEGIEVPWRSIAEDTLTRFIEEFATRQASVSADDVALDVAVGRCRAGLEKGLVVLLFDPATESFTLALRESLR